MVRIRWLVALAVTGLVLTWIGGYVRASQNSVCIDGVNPRDSRCYGTFTSDAWQVTGLISLGVGIALMLGAVLLGLSRRRSEHSVPSRAN
jgi:hypothetical protein